MIKFIKNFWRSSELSIAKRTVIIFLFACLLWLFLSEFIATQIEIPQLHRFGVRILTNTTFFIIISIVLFKLLKNGISTLKEEHQKTEESKKLYKLIADNTADVIWRYDLINEKFEFVSPSIKKLRGFTQEEILKISFKDALTKDSYNEILPILNEKKRLYEEGESSARVNRNEIKQPHKNGRIIDVEVVTTFIKNEEGKVTSLLGVSRDITERFKTESALKESEQRFRALFEKHDAVMLLVDPDSGKILKANNAAVQFYGYDQVELLWMNIKDINILSEDDIKIRRNNAIHEIENKFVAPHRLANGAIRTVEVHSSPIKMRGKNILFSIIFDISEQEKIRKALEERESLLSESQRVAQIGTYNLNIEDNTWTCTEVMSSILGIPANHIKNFESWLELVHPDEREEMLNYFTNEVIGKKKNFDKEYRIVRKSDNDIRWVYGKGKLTFTGDGNPQFMFGTIYDITDRKNAEKILKENEEKYRTIVQTALDGFFIINHSAKIIEVNDTYCKMSGYSHDELLNMRISDLEASENTTQTLQRIDEIITNGFARFETTHRAKDGNIIWVEVSARFNEGFIYTFISNRTEAKKNEEKILQLSSAVEQSPVSIILTNSQGNIEYVNPKFTSVTGYSRDQVIGQNPRILKSGFMSKGIYKELWDSIIGGKNWSGIFQNKTKDGRLIWESAIISPIRNSEGKITHFLAIKEDITKKVQAEDELKVYRKHLEELVKIRTLELNRINNKLEQELEKEKEYEMMLSQSLNKEKDLNELKSRFISTASHEFRTPLTSILSSTELIERYGKKWSQEKVIEHISRIKSSVDYVTRLLDDVLTISRTESGKIIFKPQKTDLQKLCKEIIGGDSESTVKVMIYILIILWKLNRTLLIPI